MWTQGYADQGQPEVYETKTGKTIHITETHPVGQSLSNVRVSTEGLEHDFDQTIEDADPVKEVLVADLDSNGFDEIYIVTVAAGSGSYGNVLGFASNRDLSLSMVNFPEVVQGEAAFEGYMGHDVFTIENRWLVRSFPIYGVSETNAEPGGETRRVLYSLNSGEAMWQLKIERVESAN